MNSGGNLGRAFFGYFLYTSKESYSLKTKRSFKKTDNYQLLKLPI